jgi:OmpA-OmpF porin, OOP family
MGSHGKCISALAAKLFALGGKPKQQHLKPTGMFMKIRERFDLRRIFLLLAFLMCFSLSWQHAPALADEPSVEEMIGALSKKGAEATPGAARSRSIGGKPAAPSGQLQLSVQFELGSANVSPASRELLAKLGAAMNSPALAGQLFRIEGHTDSTGDAAGNQRLSERRAQSVQAFLEKNSGVVAGRLLALGKGSSEPLDPTNPKAAVNRRVVIATLDAAAAPVAPATAPAVEKEKAAPPAAATSVAASPAVAPSGTSAAVGTVKQLRGEATITRANVTKKVVEGDTVSEGDVIAAAAGTSVLVQFSDDAKLLVRPGSTVRLAEFSDSGPIEKRSQLMELTAGALRFVTGALGKLRPQSVRFKTPTAYVGIRGTDIEIVYTPAARGLRSAGTYVRVNTGAIDLNGNDGSTVALTANEQALAAPQGAPLRGGGRAPAAKKLDAPADVFVAGELDSLLEGK